MQFVSNYQQGSDLSFLNNFYDADMCLEINTNVKYYKPNWLIIHEKKMGSTMVSNTVYMYQATAHTVVAAVAVALGVVACISLGVFGNGMQS